MTKTTPAEVLRQAREALALNADIDPQATIVERLAKTRAVLAAIDALPSAPAWPCHCDERGIGKPGVTCGDCPRDYGHAVSSAPSGEPAATFSPVTVLPDGSAFATAAFPLPKDHWLTAPRGEWDSERDEYAECPAPILTHAHRDAVRAAVRYAVRGATMCGQDSDFDPDALVLNAIYALCGPFGGATIAPAPLLSNGLTEAETSATASVAGLAGLIRQQQRDAAPQAAPVPAPSITPEMRQALVRGLYTGKIKPPASPSVATPEPTPEYLFIQMDDDGRAWHRWCADVAEVHEAVKAAMFILPAGEELSAEHTDQLDASVDVLIDDGRLSFEGDPPLYLFRMAGATWEKAPAAQAAPAPQAAVQPLTDEQVKDCLVKAHCFGSVRLTYDSGPYEVTSPTVDAIRLAGVIVSEFCRLAGIATPAPKEQQP